MAEGYDIVRAGSAVGVVAARLTEAGRDQIPSVSAI